MVELINEQFLKDNELILEVNGNQFLIPKALGEFLQKTNSLNDDTVEMTKSKTGVVTLKIKSLTYKPYNFKGKGNTKTLNLYKKNNIPNDTKGEKTMRFYIKFMKPKFEGKVNPFNNLVLKIVKPAIAQKEFSSLDEAQDAISKALDELRSDKSEWVIEKNTKIEGLVVKNTYKRPDKEFPSHNIFFVNVVQPKEAEAE